MNLRKPGFRQGQAAAVPIGARRRGLSLYMCPKTPKRRKKYNIAAEYNLTARFLLF